MVAMDSNWLVIPISTFVLGTVGLYLAYMKKELKLHHFDTAMRMLNGVVIGAIALLLLISYVLNDIKVFWVSATVVMVFIILSLSIGQEQGRRHKQQARPKQRISTRRKRRR